MNDNTDQVVYEFLGDVTSLRQATTQAIKLLDSYQTQIDRISADGGFGKSARAAKSFQNVVKTSTKDITAMQQKMKDLSDVKLTPGTNVQKMIASSLGSLEQVQAKLKTSTKLTTKEVQTLTNQLKSTQQAARENAAGVEALISKEVKFQQTLTTVDSKIRQFRSRMDGLRTGVSKTFDPLIQRLNTLRNPFARIVQSVQVFKAKALDSFGRVTQLATTVASAFRRVSSSEDAANSSATRTARAHRDLANSVERVHRSARKETKAIQEEDEALDVKNQDLKTSTKEHDSLGSGILNLLNIFKRETKTILGARTSFNALSRILGVVKSAFVSLTGLQVGSWFADATNKSIEFKENLNLFTVAMGDAYEQGFKFVEQMQEIYGMDPSNLMRYAGNFYQLADAIDMASGASANLALGLTKATNDIASLFNVDIETVFENLSSGMQGMSRAVRKYGMDIRAVTLQATAASLGIDVQVESMSEANRQGLRFITMMRQAANANGDFARTIESPANQLRILKEQMSQLGRAIGDLFIDPLGEALKYLNGFIMALRIVITYIGTLLGVGESLESDVEISEDAAESISNIGSEAESTTKKLKKMLAPFDELNVLQDPSASEGGLSDLGNLDPRIEEAIENMKWELDDVRMKANEVRDSLLKFFGFTFDAGKILSWDPGTFEQNLIAKFPEWTKTIQATFKNWESIVNGFKAVFIALGSVISTAWSRIDGFLSKFVTDESMSEFIGSIAGKLEKLASVINNNQDVVIAFAVGIAAAMAALKGLGVIAGLAPVISDLISLLGSITPAMLQTVGIVGTVIVSIILLYKNSNKFASSFRKLLNSVFKGLATVAKSVGSTLKTIWTGLKTLWTNNVQPMLKALGDFLAPVLDTISALFGNVVSILSGAFTLISNIWTSTLQPVLAAVFDAISEIAVICESLWTTALGPILEYIGTGLVDLWDNTLSPIIQKVIEIVGSLVEAILGLWNNVLSPLVKWIVDSLGPPIQMIFKTIRDVVSQVVEDIGNVLSGLLTTLGGLTDFLAGVFTGDWERAWKGLVNILVGVGNTIIGVFELVVNTIISLINTMISAIYSGVVGLINLLTGSVEGIANLIGYDLELTISAPPPAIPAVTIPKIPEVALAAGAVVTGPTRALIGEGRYDEAVIPLGNSPQMNEFAANVADRVGGDEQVVLLREQNDLLRQILEKTGTNLDGRMISDSMSMYQRNRARGRGV